MFMTSFDDTLYPVHTNILPRPAPTKSVVYTLAHVVDTPARIRGRLEDSRKQRYTSHANIPNPEQCPRFVEN
jgi:hypothetical protein